MSIQDERWTLLLLREARARAVFGPRELDHRVGERNRADHLGLLD